MGTSHIPGDISSIKVIKTGQNVRAVVYAHDGSIIRDQTKPLPDGATVTYVSRVTNYSGNILSASIRNDTTGETVWQAAYSDLYDTSNPWPSPVPENFAEKAKAFYDCQAVVQEALDPTHDYKFLFDFEIIKESGEASVFYAGAANFPFGVYCYSDNTIIVFTNLLRGKNDATSAKHTGSTVYSGDTRLQGRHTIELSIEGDTRRFFLDGSEIVQKYETVRTGTAAVGLPNCNSGYVYKIQITDLTDNQVVWSYPSEAERVRLITKTNVRTDRGTFEVANPAVNSFVSSALDLRNRISSYTVRVEFEPSIFSNQAVEQHQDLAGQGSGLIGAGYPPICALSYYKASDGSLHLRFAQQAAQARQVADVTLDASLSGRHVLIGMLELIANDSYLHLYLDGTELVNAHVVGRPDGSTYSDAKAFSIAGVENSFGWINQTGTGKVYSVLLFDRTFSAAKIAAMS